MRASLSSRKEVEIDRVKNDAALRRVQAHIGDVFPRKLDTGLAPRHRIQSRAKSDSRALFLT